MSIQADRDREILARRSVEPFVKYNAGRIECYLHSDSTTPNKGGVMYRVACQTDFAAKTPEFIEFAKKIGKFIYACPHKSQLWRMVCATFPELEQERVELEKKLKEKIDVYNITRVALDD